MRKGLPYIMIVLFPYFIVFVLSGLVGLSGVMISVKEKKIPINKAILHGILQFVFCADIFSAIVLYRTVKAIQ